VGIDGFAGPERPAVIAHAGADRELVALDLLAQAEHGEDSLVVAVSDDAALLDAIAAAAARPTVAAARCGRAAIGGRAGVREALAPEHLQLVGGAAEALAPRVRAPAACSSARERRPRSATTSRARTTRCRPAAPRASPPAVRAPLPPARWRGAHRRRAAALAPRGVPIAEAEGFAAHAESMAPIRENPPR
jgi:histidinol dehydrogenase